MVEILGFVVVVIVLAIDPLRLFMAAAIAAYIGATRMELHRRLLMALAGSVPLTTVAAFLTLPLGGHLRRFPVFASLTSATVEIFVISQIYAAWRSRREKRTG
jgi:hypothetical protein